eukprot:1160188-Ditylum_brightwellii.AAC.1
MMYGKWKDRLFVLQRKRNNISQEARGILGKHRGVAVFDSTSNKDEIKEASVTKKVLGDTISENI